MAVLASIFAVYGLATRRPPLTLVESQARIDERISELSGYLGKLAVQASPGIARQMALDTAAAKEIDRLLEEDPEVWRIYSELSESGGDEVPALPDPSDRVAALAYPALQYLLQAWSTGTIEPSEEPATPFSFWQLQRFATESLGGAIYRGDTEAAYLWASHCLFLIEGQLRRQEFDSQAIAGPMLSMLASKLKTSEPGAFRSAARESLLQRVRALPPMLLSPQEMGAALMMANLAANRDEQPSLDGDERAEFVAALEEVRTWNDRALSTLAMESEPDRARAFEIQATTVGSLSDEARSLAAHTDNLHGMHQQAMDAIAEIIRRLERE